MTTAYTNTSTKIAASDLDQEIQSIATAPPTVEELKRALSCIDLTSLEGKDTEASIQELCKKGITTGVAAICVYPTLVKTAKNALKNTTIKVASVAGAFPSGQLPLHLRLEEVKYALTEGADEIDMVINRGEFLGGNHAFTLQEVAAVKAVCGKTTLKVILETGELETTENIALASRLAIEGGADFIKTSTGKIAVNATLPYVYVMLKEIRAYRDQTGKKVGIKASGGIADGVTAVQYMRLTEQVLGKEWLQPALFRIGASRLVNNLVSELNNISKAL